MSIHVIPQHPFVNIGMSASGGGYRAASFHLGAMAYLHRLHYDGRPLLENVRMISTVSGGTITGVIYALQQQQGKTFENTYHFILQKLRTLDLVQLSLLTLNPGTGLTNKHKRKNMINAFAELYDKHFTGGATFEVFNKMTSHLEAVAFNSTEFRNGINFRFRNKGTGFFGNNSIKVPQNLAEEVKLADAMAASSCFTGGFEPIIWPHDFVHDGAKNLEAFAEKQSPMGIMDGGIYDNQGIDALLLYKKNAPTPFFDLIIISDVTSPYMDPFQPKKDEDKKGIRQLTVKQAATKVRKINRNITAGLVIAIIVFLLIPFIKNYQPDFLTGFCVAFALWFAILLIAKNFLMGKLQKAGRAILGWVMSKIPKEIQPKLAKLKVEELSIRRIEPLLIDRFNSLITLMLDVFLKVVRRLNYYKLYSNDRYAYRRISNLIRELTEKDFTTRQSRETEYAPNSENYLKHTILKGPYEQVVGPKIAEVATNAAAFGTTLWFTDKQQTDKLLDQLVASGQVTMCYNLLHYLETIIFETGNGFNGLDKSVQEQIRTMYAACKADWLRFKEEPMFLVNEMIG